MQTGAQLLGPYITKIAIDRYIAERDIGGLDLMALAYLGVVLFGFIVLFIQTYTTQYTGQRAMHDLRMEIFSHLQKQDMAYFDRNAVGRLMTRTVNDVETLNELFSTGVVGLLGRCVDRLRHRRRSCYGSTGSWRWFVWPLSRSILYVSRFYRRRAREVYRESRLILGRLNAGLQENIAGVATIQAFGQEEKMYRRFQEINLQLPRRASAQHPLQRGIFSGYRNIQRAEHRAVAVVRRPADPFQRRAGRRDRRLYPVYPAHVPADPRPGGEIQHHASRHGFLRTNLCAARYAGDHQKSGSCRKRAERFAGDVEFKDVWLSYRADEPVLKGISFRVRAGEKVALVGATGGGKTSIISALCRFYEVERGAILVDGIDIREWNKQDLRRHLGLVLQDVFLFSGDIATNITLGDARIGEAHMREAARRAHIAPFIEQLPRRYHEEVQERGSTLSQGQRQLLSFARALAFDPKILVLDEATSSVDTQTEALVQEALDELLKNRTALIIAHRLSTIKHADRILVIHKGEIWEEGSHEALLAKRRTLRALVRLAVSLSGTRR